MTVFEVIRRLTDLGCAVRVEGEQLKVRGPDRTEVPQLVSELRARRKEAICVLSAQESKPPSIEEIKVSLPPGFRLVSYQPRQVPFAVAPVSVVTSAGKFFRAYLTDLRWRIENPNGRAAPPVADILAKLEDAGLTLTADGDCHSKAADT